MNRKEFVNELAKGIMLGRMYDVEEMSISKNVISLTFESGHKINFNVKEEEKCFSVVFYDNDFPIGNYAIDKRNSYIDDDSFEWILSIVDSYITMDLNSDSEYEYIDHYVDEYDDWEESEFDSSEY